MNKIKMVLLFVVFCISVSFAADVYTLDDCLRIARENNATLKSAKVNRQMAEETEGSAFPAYFPKVFAGGFAFISNDFLVKQKMDLSKEMEGLGQQVAPAMTQAGLDPSILAGLPTTFNMGMLDKGIVGHLTLIQPIFVGGQIYNGNQLAKIGTRAAKLQESLTETEIRKNTETYYWLIVSLREKMKTLTEAEKQIEAIYGDVKTAVEAGVAVKNDLLRVELEKKKLQSNRLKLENGISVAKLMLARQMNRDNANFDLVETDLEKIEPPESYAISADDAVERRAESKLLAISREAAEKERSMERGKVLPTVAVGASLLYQNLLDDDAVNGVLFASLTVPISDWWGNSYSTAKFDLKAQKAAIDEAENKNLIKVDIDAKWNTLNESFRQIEISRDAVAQAEENLRMQREYYNAGTATLSNMLEAETLRQQASDSYTEAVTGYYTAVCAYLVATGR
ncbi:TolC family protein [Fibrobacter sp.]|uniref:TolC family protein n=1 Tax=Fibrobacter sp. TaxID=35828 RepID=UPI0038691372